MKNIVILGVFAATVVAIGGAKVAQRFRIDSPNVVVHVSDRSSSTDFDWSGVIRAGNTVEIKGINGDIRAEYTEGNQVRVHAERESRSRRDSRDVRIEVVQHDGGVTLCAVYPSRGDRNRCAPGDGGHLSNNNNNTEVDFTVYVPTGVGFRANTVNGDVEARGLTAHAYAETVNGDVVLHTTGFGEAETVNGDIIATIGDVTEGLNFSSVNGDLIVTLPADIDANIVGETLSGDISSDFSLAIQNSFGHKNFRGTLGDGGHRIRMESVNGDIEIVRH